MPIRTCAMCRARASSEDLLRFVRVGETAAFDAGQAAPGRGAWLHPGCLGELARRPESLGRALRGRATAAPDLADQVGSFLKRAIADGLLQARRSGLASEAGDVAVSGRTRALRRKMALLAAIG
jgi:predicted RNA-binding protein YlxR (DUF448 family)